MATLKDFNRVIETQHHDPHQILGLHDVGGKRVIRLWRPGATEIYLELKGEMVKANRIQKAGLFELEVPAGTTYLDYKVYHNSGLLAHDPYAFLPTIGDVDQYLFGQGTHYEIYRVMGARPFVQQGVEGVRFTVWAPAAKRVSVIADFNHYDGRVNPLRSLGGSGIWELFVPGLKVGEKYKFEIKTQEDGLRVKADPFALQSEVRPLNASVVARLDGYEWRDREWMEKREKEPVGPLNVYEVHLGSWRKRDGNFINYRELAVALSGYCLEMGFNAIELMPVMEHPFDESWGYQVTGFYAATSRFGTGDDFRFFVDHMHQKGIRVILDWVPGHFPTDEFALARFDGTAIYEHEDPRQGFHPHWNTLIFNFGRHEVINFLIGSALFWCEQMHVDGLRVDAVASMLYLDYGREAGEWIPNKYGGKENLEAIEFLKHLNSIIHKRNPGVLMIAEESTSFAGVTQNVDRGGLGFDLKWNMGWMNDTLRYFTKDMLFRRYHHNDLTFGLLYAFSEKFMLVFSHDEVVHGKGSLMGKMPGDMWQRFANMRLLYSYMIGQPGKKLLFMGSEIGQWNEWNSKGEVEWFLLRYPTHHGLQTMIRDLNHLYLQTAALWAKDHDFSGFEWVDFSDQDNCVICYLRKSNEEIILCVHNFTPVYHEKYHVRVRNAAEVKEIFNTDAAKYGGSGKENPTVEIQKETIIIHLAPLASQFFKITFR